MGARPAGPDLEVVAAAEAVSTAGGVASAPGRWSRWLLVGSLLAVLLFGGAILTLRSRALANRARDLQSTWSTAAALDQSRMEQVATLRALAGPQDDERARLASARLNEEEARLLAARHPARVAPWRRDEPLDHLGQVMAGYLRLQVRDRRLAATALRGGDSRPELPIPLSPPEAATQRVIDELLGRQLIRFHIPRPAPPRPLHLTGAEADLEVLGTFAHEATASRLLAGADGGIVELDLDASRAIPQPLAGIDTVKPPLFEPALVLRSRSVAFVVAYYGAPSVAYARSLAPAAAVVRLGPADGLAPADAADSVWLAQGSTLTEVRVTDAAVVGGPFPLPVDAAVVGTVPRGLLLKTAANEIVRFDLASGSPTVLGRATFTFSAPDGSLMWADAAGSAHLTRPDGGGVTAHLPAGTAAIGPGALAPDAHRLADFLQRPDGSWQLQLMDLTSGVMKAVEGATAARAPASVIWSADGSRVFWLEAHARQGLATYRLGSPRAEVLRVGTLDIESIVLLP